MSKKLIGILGISLIMILVILSSGCTTNDTIENDNDIEEAEDEALTYQDMLNKYPHIDIGDYGCIYLISLFSKI